MSKHHDLDTVATVRQPQLGTHAIYRLVGNRLVMRFHGSRTACINEVRRLNRVYDPRSLELIKIEARSIAS